LQNSSHYNGKKIKKDTEKHVFETAQKVLSDKFTKRTEREIGKIGFDAIVCTGNTPNLLRFGHTLRFAYN
jgi:hypothetical protein